MASGRGLAVRQDGKVLRLFTTPGGEDVFVWATCHMNAEPNDGQRATFLTDPDEVRQALGLVVDRDAIGVDVVKL
jgi:hypothetical protein